MRILWSYLVVMLLIVYETNSQLTRQQMFSKIGNTVPYILYFDSYIGQTLTLTFSTQCPNLQIIFANQMGSIISNYSTVGHNNGSNFSYSFGIGMGTKQSISLIDWTGTKTCNWSFNFMLNFSCQIVNSNCYDCSSYTTCTYCVSGYFLYSNLCYLNIPNCLTRFGLTCVQCVYGYILNNGNCMGCSLYMPNCLNCSSQTLCTNCPNGYTFMSGNAGCAICSSFIPNCTICTSSSVCTTCPSGFALADAVTCQFCNVTLSNCITCLNISVCTQCTTGFALDSNYTCQPCSTLISNCVLCSSSSYCQKCSVGYSLSPTACTLCSFSMDGCSKCNATNCLSCYDGYWYNSTLMECFKCTASMPNCNGSCINSTWCTRCSQGYGLKNAINITRDCSSCSTISSQCVTCWDMSICTTCIDGYYIFNYYYYMYNYAHNDCFQCTWFLNYCASCFSTSACYACINTGYALYTNYHCYPCSNWMDSCLNCSDYSTCTRCASGTFLVNGRCKPCFVLIPNCNICSSKTVCTSCQTTYYLDTATGNCQPCSFFLPNCTLCSSTTTCTQCMAGTVLQSGQCKTCAEVFPNCVGCINNVSCAVCNYGFVPNPNQCQPCGNFMSHCSNCYDAFYCQECFDPYLVNSQKICKCKPPLFNVSDFCVDDPNCVSAYKKDGQIYCGFCNVGALFQLDSNYRCVCKTGYTQVNSQCVVVCGDGLIIKQECDDNNTIDGDGCSSKCRIQPDFTCSQLPSGMSFCRFVKNIELKYDYTFKMIHQNKGRMYFSLISTNPAIIKFYFSQNFKFTITHNRSNSLNVTSFEMDSQGQIMIDIEYNETIQDSLIYMSFNFNNSFVISEPCSLKFPMKGTNYPLVISELNQNYQVVYNFAKYVILIEYGLGLLLLFSDKFIAVEAINTIQLTFFSLLLIYANSDWPMAIVALLPLKYSTGFNQLIFKPNTYDNINNNAYRKFQYVGISNYFVANNLINCVILIIAFFITTILFSVKSKRQNDLLEIKAEKQIKRQSKQLNKFGRILKKVYNITFNFSYIMILQVVLSIYVEFSFLKTLQPLMMVADKLLSMLTLTILFVTVLQNYKHLFLSVKDTYVQNFKIGSWEVKYRRVYFIYIFLNAVCIFFLNDKKLFKLTVSFFVLIMAVIYLLFLIIYRPYKHSFSIHGFTICLNQVMFIISLLMVNSINFNVQIAEVVFLAFDYLLIGFSLAIMFLATVRVFYDWKYSQEHIQKKIKLEIDQKKQIQSKRLLNRAAKKEQKKNINNKNHQNTYIYENQKLQAQKVDYLNDLKNKTYLNEWEKDHAYFNVYDRKPLGWVLQNQTQEKYKALLQKEQQRFLNDAAKQKIIQMKNQKLLDKNYVDELQKIKQKLRNQHAIRQTKREQKKQGKRSKMRVQNLDK